jgi:hypothetical protein
MAKQGIGQSLVLLVRLMGALVYESLTAPWSETRIVIYDTGRITRERSGRPVWQWHRAGHERREGHFPVPIAT